MHTNHNIPYFSIIVSILVLTSCASAVDDPDVCRTMNLVYCDGICADPMTSPKYCGANDSCSDYTSCNSDEYCTEGHCKKVTTETHDESGTCTDFKKYCKNNSIIGCINGNITVEEFCTGSTPVCDPHTVTCTALPEAICTDGDFKCESNVPSVCIGNTWHTKSLCAKGTYCNSLSGECTSGPVELDPEESCETDSVRCENNVPVVCSESRWILREKCDDDSYCNSMTAHCDKIETLDCNKTPDDPQCTAVQPPTPVCSNAEQRCFYGKIQQCQDNEWTDLASCESGKCANEKDCEQLVCHTGDTQCSDAILQMCADNAWLDVLECPSGICKDGKCIESQQTTKTVVCNGEQIDPMTSDNYCGADDECQNYVDCTTIPYYHWGITELKCYKGTCHPKCIPRIENKDLEKFMYDYQDANSDFCISPDEYDAIPQSILLAFWGKNGNLYLDNFTTIPENFYTNYFANSSIELYRILLPNTTEIKEKAFYKVIDDDPVQNCNTGNNKYNKFNIGKTIAENYRFIKVIFPKVIRIGDNAFSSNRIKPPTIMSTYYNAEYYGDCIGNLKSDTTSNYYSQVSKIDTNYVMDELSAPNLEYLGEKALYSLLAKKYYFPTLTQIRENAISIACIYPNPEIHLTSSNDLYLSPGWINRDCWGITNQNASCPISNCKVADYPEIRPILYLNKNKKPGGSGYPIVDLENMTFAGEKIKEVFFVD